MITEYVKGKPYFGDVKKKLKQFPYLDKNIETDVLIIGGGIDGAITNYYFSCAGIKTTLIDKHKIGYMNTTCATALLEYQLDDNACDLTKVLTKQQIVDVYNLGIDSLFEIKNLIAKHKNSCHYHKKDTLLFSSKKSDYEDLLREFEFRKQNNFKVHFIDKQNNPFAFNIEAGIYAIDGGADFNPYLFACLMIENSKNLKNIFEHTEATEILKTFDGYKVITNYGIEILCKKIICCTGYNTKLFTEKQLCEKFISYTIVTNKLNVTWHKKCLIQDNLDPYHYIRFSHDNRIIVGGEDIPFKNSTITEKDAEKYYQKLFEFIVELLPEIKDHVKIDYKFCGAFSATTNNLSVVGPATNDENLWYNLGYGANGIIYSVYGAKALLSLYYGEVDKNLYLFSPNRDLP